MISEQYTPSEKKTTTGEKETDTMLRYYAHKDDALKYFKAVTKPRLDRSYKLFIADNSDRAKEIQKWQSNITIPYIQAVVETMIPRILDARPNFSVQGRNADDQLKAEKVQNLLDYTWEVSKGDKVSEDSVRSSLIYGTGYFQVGWKKDVRKAHFLKTADINKKKYEWEEREEILYDAPFIEHVDNYSLMYDWHNIKRESKQFWFKRLILTEAEIKRRYPNYDKKKLEMALEHSAGCLEDYASIRNEVKYTHEDIIKGADYSSGGGASNIYQTNEDQKLNMHEVFEYYRPFEDSYAIMVNDVPILKGVNMYFPYNFKEIPFIEIPYLRLPNEFEGIGIPMVLENSQIALNMMKNQRLDAVTLSIHRMWIVNPMANINKDELVTRPFGIIYSPDTNGVKEIQFGDIKPSAYREEEMLKDDMRHASGIDDASMGAGSGASSATEVRHLRESTLERVRMFVNHLGDAYSDVMRTWFSMYGQFMDQEKTIRITGGNGQGIYPIIERDDVKGEFDFKASVIPSIAGQIDIDRKQSMDLYQLLMQMQLPFIDPQKLTRKVLHPFNWSLDSIIKQEEEQMMPEQGMMPEEEGQLLDSGDIPPEVARAALGNLGSKDVRFMGEQQNPFAEAAMPINLLQGGKGAPPTAAGLPTTNPGGLNMGGMRNPNSSLNVNQNSTPESNMLNRAFNPQSSK